ncbi:MAG: Kazal-type serine protease inhibitor family protein [Janthinobacterium lividum]
MCPMVYEPVCGCDGKTYANACIAGHAGVRTHRPGACPTQPAPR